MNRILLVGNPNCGKTTIFNRLTGASGRVGNWHGVTVSAIEKKVRGSDYVLVDLPGLYSLSAYSGEEKAALGEIYGADDGDIILNVIEACNLKRALSLTAELKKTKKRVAVVINMYAELTARGGKIDLIKLSEAIGCPCFFAEELKAKRIDEKFIKSANFVRFTGDLPQGTFEPPREYVLKGADKMLFGAFAIPIFILTLAGAVYLTFGRFGAGKLLGDLLRRAIEEFFVPMIVKALLSIGVGDVLIGLLADGIVGGVTGVVAFVPQLAVLYLCLILLEESGFLPRAAFAFDGALKKVGLSGKAVFPLLAGLGCTASAITCTRGMESEAVQKRTVAALFFLPCSARMPVFLLLISTFFAGREFAAVVIVYALGIALGLLFAKLRTKADKIPPEPFAVEIPPLRKPKALSVVKQLKNHLKSFIIKVGTVLVIVSTAVWLLRSFSISGEFLPEERIAESLLAKIGAFLSFVFVPMGLGGWQIPVAAICGLIAKEGIVGALALVFPAGLAAEISAESALSLFVFFALYTPCVMAISASVNEAGGGFSAFYGVFGFLAALLAGYL
ncbi:MAG: ferrous iron transporter B, partial [Clostridia bacterium]|nr:ferrous iron transporter B [Clostridia bacterium]